MQRAAGLLCLVAMVMGMPGVIPGCIAAVAFFEGSHRVLFHDGDSAMEVVLQHDGEAGTSRAPHHQHCLTAKLVVLLAETDTQEADHVLKFTASRAALKSDTIGWKPIDVALDVPLIAPEQFFLTIAKVDLLPAEHAPPPVNAHLLSLRTTVLVI